MLKMTLKNTNKPIVSIIINCLNGEKYLREAINSIYNQSYKNWEIIFWDNGSTDNSKIIAKSFDKKLRYFYSQYTTTLGQARINAVKKAKGKYLCFLDCDDIWLKDKLKLQVSKLKDDKNLSLVYSKAEIINEYGKKIGLMPSKKDSKSGYVFKDLVKKNFIPFVSVLIRKTTYFDVGGFPKDYINSMDYHLFLNISLKNRIMFLPKITCKYREHSQNLSKYNIVKSVEEEIMTLKKLLPNKYVKNALSLKYADLSIDYLKKLKFLNSLYYLIFFSDKKYFFERLFKKFTK